MYMYAHMYASINALWIDLTSREFALYKLVANIKCLVVPSYFRAILLAITMIKYLYRFHSL